MLLPPRRNRRSRQQSSQAGTQQQATRSESVELSRPQMNSAPVVGQPESAEADFARLADFHAPEASQSAGANPQIAAAAPQTFMATPDGVGSTPNIIETTPYNVETTPRSDVDASRADLVGSPVVTDAPHGVSGTPQATANLPPGASGVEKHPLREKRVNDQTPDDTEFLRGIRRGAQVWTTYVKESKDYDEDLVDGWNRSLDVTLVFAALFSAILTAFVLESVKTLSPDPAEITAVTLIEISSILRATAAGAPAVEQSSPTGVAEFIPTTNAVWVNGLWFFSLSLSVAVSLAAMLAKQWCYYFLRGRTGDPFSQAEERQKRYNGLETWKMKKILEFMPVLMHLSLALFSVGLVLYLWGINVAVAAAVTAVTLSALLFYLATTIVPVGVPFCPFMTPQSVYAKDVLGALVKHQTLPGKVAGVWKRKLRERLHQLRGNHSGLPSTMNRNNEPEQVSDRLSPIRAFFQHAWKFATSWLSSYSESNQVNPISHVDQQTLDEEDSFVKRSLSWLIEHCQNPTSIDTAIGALAIGGVHLENEGMEIRITSHLVKSFSHCFVADKNSVELHLVRSNTNMKLLAVDYVRWMSHFAGDSARKTDQILLVAKTLGNELVTHLGLALASLAKQKPPPDVNQHIAMWIVSFIECYELGNTGDPKALYFSEEVLSVLIEGLTVAGLEVISADASERAKILVVPQLIGILYNVSHIRGSRLRLSIGVNLAVFALSAKLYYPMTDQRGFTSAASRLATNHRPSRNQHSYYVSVVLLGLLGFVHPKNDIGLESKTMRIICYMIIETDFLGADDVSISLPGLEDFGPLRRRMAATLVEAIVQVSSQNRILITSPDLHRLILWSTISTSQSWNGGPFATQTFSSILEAVCCLIIEHIFGRIVLHPESLTGLTDLLSREVKGRQLDYKLLDPELFDRLEMGLTSSPADQLSLMEGTDEEFTPERKASFTLACVISKSKHRQCTETAVRAILHHSNNCSVELVVQAAKRFSEVFYRMARTSTIDNQVAGSSDAGEKLSASGYGRIMALMALHCSDPSSLSQYLSNQNNKENTFENVQIVYKRLAAARNHPHMHAFGISGLAVWSFACLDREHSTETTQGLLKQTWELIASNIGGSLRHEALEALIDTTSLLSAVTKPPGILLPAQAQLLLRLVKECTSQLESNMRHALAVAFTFWGLSLEPEEWPFWTINIRREYWREYKRSDGGEKDIAALSLLGLSRLLEHYSQLMLDHTSISTIAEEIYRHMSMRIPADGKMTLPFLPKDFDVRRHVRETVGAYLRETETFGPFTKSATASRERLLSAIQTDGGEGYVYELPQPFVRKIKMASDASA